MFRRGRHAPNLPLPFFVFIREANAIKKKCEEGYAPTRRQREALSVQPKRLAVATGIELSPGLSSMQDADLSSIVLGLGRASS